MRKLPGASPRFLNGHAIGHPPATQSGRDGRLLRLAPGGAIAQEPTNVPPDGTEAPLQPRAPSVGGPFDEILERGYVRRVELAAQDDAERERGIRLLKVITGDPEKPYVALTFDDGPHGTRTTPLLDLLHRLGVPATFFVIGKQVAKFPGLVQRMAVEGHEIGNHTYNHYRLTRIPLEQVPLELNATRDLIYSILGIRVRLMRPPGGDYTPTILKIAEENGYVTILWTDDPADFAPGRTTPQIRGFVLRDATPGGIILLHDGIPATWGALPDIVASLRAQGLIFVTVSELIQRGGGLMRVRNIRISRTAAR
jgi:peptidoglycan/xylan/chitin deacetylase (PgdA/CDA1 family)